MEPLSDYRERPLVMVLADLARFTQVISELSLRETAAVLDGFYRAAEDVVADAGGRVVKFVGDGCLAAFGPDDVLAALDTVDLLAERVRGLGARQGVGMEVGANVHLATVAEVRLGIGPVAELVGMGVVHTYRMGGGPGVRISEPVYRKLPSERRSTWRKRQPPATYSRDDHERAAVRCAWRSCCWTSSRAHASGTWRQQKRSSLSTPSITTSSRSSTPTMALSSRRGVRATATSAPSPWRHEPSTLPLRSSVVAISGSPFEPPCCSAKRSLADGDYVGGDRQPRRPHPVCRARRAGRRNVLGGGGRAWPSRCRSELQDAGRAPRRRCSRHDRALSAPWERPAAIVSPAAHTGEPRLGRDGGSDRR